jgi:hypothetical protein
VGSEGRPVRLSAESGIAVKDFDDGGKSTAALSLESYLIPPCRFVTSVPQARSFCRLKQASSRDGSRDIGEVGRCAYIPVVVDNESASGKLGADADMAPEARGRNSNARSGKDLAIFNI